MNPTETLNKKRDLGPLNPLLVVFENDQIAKSGLATLLRRGYLKSDIQIENQDDFADRPCQVQNENEEDTVTVTVKKIARGAGFGALMGASFTGIVFMLLILSGSFLIQTEPLVSELFAIFIGGVFGGIMGLLIGPQLPFQSKKLQSLTIEKGNVLFRFLARDTFEKSYLKSQNWQVYTAGI